MTLEEAKRLLEDRQQSTPRWIIPAELQEALSDVGSRLPEIWEQNLLTPVQMKTLVRTMIDKVVLHRLDDDLVQVRIVWRGGATTSENVSAPRNYHTFDEMPSASEAKAKILEMAEAGRTDKEIAEYLTTQGYRGAKTAVITRAQVQRVRLDAGIRQRTQRAPHRDGFLTVNEISEELDVSSKWIYHRIADGSLHPMLAPGFKLHVFPNMPQTLQEIKQLADSDGAPPRLTRCKAKSALSCEP